MVCGWVGEGVKGMRGSVESWFAEDGSNVSTSSKNSDTSVSSDTAITVFEMLKCPAVYASACI